MGLSKWFPKNYIYIKKRGPAGPLFYLNLVFYVKLSYYVNKTFILILWIRE